MTDSESFQGTRPGLPSTFVAPVETRVGSAPASVVADGSALLDGEAFNTAIADAVRDRAFSLSINDVGPVAPTAALVDGDQAFFLSINDVGPVAPTAALVDGDQAFFLSINDVDE